MNDRWKNRRKMAWGSFIGAMIFPLLVLFTESDQLGALSVAFYTFCSAVVGAYIGFATWDDKTNKDQNGT